MTSGNRVIPKRAPRNEVMQGFNGARGIWALIKASTPSSQDSSSLRSPE
jgi:hypothetical protein